MTLCPRCGNEMRDDLHYCHTCGQPKYYPQQGSGDSTLLTAGAVMCFIAGVLNLFPLMLLLMWGAPPVFNIWVVLIVLFAILSPTVTFLAGIWAIMKKNWTLAVIFAIIGIFNFGFLFSIIGVIFIGMSHSQFREGGQAPYYGPAPYGPPPWGQAPGVPQENVEWTGGPQEVAGEGDRAPEKRARRPRTKARRAGKGTQMASCPECDGAVKVPADDKRYPFKARCRHCGETVRFRSRPGRGSESDS